MEKISIINKSKTIDYSEKKLESFWVDNQNVEVNIPHETDFRDKIEELLNNAVDSIICIHSESVEDSRIIEVIHKASLRGNRIYLYVNDTNDTNLKLLSKRCLIRTGVHLIGSYILISPDTNGRTGLIFSGPIIESALQSNSHLLLELDKKQVSDLYRFFCDNFWNNSTEEYLQDGTKKETGDPPIDVLPPLSDCCNIEYLRKKNSEIIPKCQMMIVPEIRSDDLFFAHQLNGTIIFTSIRNNDHELIKNTGRNNRIFTSSLNEIPLLRILIADNCGVFIPKSVLSQDDQIYGIELNSDQIRKIKDLPINSKYSFVSSANRESFIGRTIRMISDIDSQISIMERGESQLENIECSEFLEKDRFESQIHERFPDDGRTCEITYSWKVVPFYTPKEANNDAIYNNWESFKNDYKKKITDAEDIIKNIEDKEKSLTDGVKSLLSKFFLGKRQKIREIKNRLIELKENEIAERPLDAIQKLIEELNNCITEIHTQYGEIEIESDKTGQQYEWQKKKDQYELEIRKKEEEIKSIHKELDEFKKQSEEKLLLKKTETDNKLNEILEKNNKTSLDDFIRELEGLNSKKGKKDNPGEAKKSEELLHDIRSIQNEYKNIENRQKSDMSSIEKKLQKIESEISYLKKESEKHGNSFIYKPTQKNKEDISDLESLSKNNQHKNTKQTSTVRIFSLPQGFEVLPEIGVLKKYNNQRYLEIAYWDEVAHAQKESKRLNAKISVKREN